jgi:hypothetical protein
MVIFGRMERSPDDPAAPTSSTVLITRIGNGGLARAVHFSSPRRGGPFRVINCAAIPETLLESELFGYERGAFTGATAAHPGLFEAAQGGTVLLDEIGSALPMQAKILRVLQEKEVRRVGGNTSLTVDVRILAATNRDLERDVRTGRFRADLYYRLCGLVIPLPPLRDRRTDIAELAEHFLARHNRENPNRRILGITPAAMEQLVSSGRAMSAAPGDRRASFFLGRLDRPQDLRRDGAPDRSAKSTLKFRTRLLLQEFARDHPQGLKWTGRRRAAASWDELGHFSIVEKFAIREPKSQFVRRFAISLSTIRQIRRDDPANRHRNKLKTFNNGQSLIRQMAVGC